MRLWWIVAGWGVLLLILGAFGYLMHRADAPKCPVHGNRMAMIGENGFADEYACQEKDCKWCADVIGNGEPFFYEV